MYQNCFIPQIKNLNSDLNELNARFRKLPKLESNTQLAVRARTLIPLSQSPTGKLQLIISYKANMTIFFYGLRHFACSILLISLPMEVGMPTRTLHARKITMSSNGAVGYVAVCMGNCSTLHAEWVEEQCSEGT
jgi:hypothetical protein